MMNKIMLIVLASVCVIVPVLAQQSEQSAKGHLTVDYSTDQPGVRFAPLHIYLDSGNSSLAAYQFELNATAGQIKIVGVEGGQHEAFKEAPYYDPAALTKDRIIIAAFNTGRDLPKDRTRIATIHLQIIGGAEPEYDLKLNIAADADGKEIPAEISFEKGE
jgi:hypothetical protein